MNFRKKITCRSLIGISVFSPIFDSCRSCHVECQWRFECLTLDASNEKLFRKT